MYLRGGGTDYTGSHFNSKLIQPHKALWFTLGFKAARCVPIRVRLNPPTVQWAHPAGDK